MVTLKARQLKVDEVHTLLGYEPKLDGKFKDYLQLPKLLEQDYSSLAEIRSNFFRYINHAKISDDTKIVLIAARPILKLSWYHQPPIYLEVEKEIDRIYIEDQNTSVVRRLNIVAVRQDTGICPLWILVVESKNTEASEIVGVPKCWPMLIFA